MVTLHWLLQSMNTIIIIIIIIIIIYCNSVVNRWQ